LTGGVVLAELGFSAGSVAVAGAEVLGAVAPASVDGEIWDASGDVAGADVGDGVEPVATPLAAATGVAVGVLAVESLPLSAASCELAPEASLESVGVALALFVAALVAGEVVPVLVLLVTTPDSGMLLRLANSSTPPPIKNTPPAISAMRSVLESASLKFNISSPRITAHILKH
jgi:hypothetical protein